MNSLKELDLLFQEWYSSNHSGEMIKNFMLTLYDENCQRTKIFSPIVGLVGSTFKWREETYIGWSSTYKMDGRMVLNIVLPNSEVNNHLKYSRAHKRMNFDEYIINDCPLSRGDSGDWYEIKDKYSEEFVNIRSFADRITYKFDGKEKAYKIFMYVDPGVNSFDIIIRDLNMPFDIEICFTFCYPDNSGEYED